MSQSTHLRKYGVETTIDFELYEVDGVNLRTDWTPAAADCEVMKDEGVSTQCTNTATDEGSTYALVLTATEMQAARLVLKIVDAATKVFLDKVIIIETYGHASAMHAMDFDDAVRGGMTALPNAAAEAAGGLYTRGTGAGQINQDANGRADVNAVAWNELATVALPLIPTVAGRTLDVSAGGEGGIDWANIGSPTTAQNLSATNIDVDQVVASVSGAVGSVGTAITLPTIPTDWITADGIAANAIGSAEIAAAALNGKGDWNTVVPPAASIFTGMTSLTEWLGAMAGKQASDATAQTEMRLTGAGSGAYDATTDSQEAIKDNTAWNTATSVTVSDKTGFALISTGLDAVTAWTVNITGTVSGNSTHDAAAVLTALGNGTWATEAGGTGDHLTNITLANDLSATMKTSVQTAVDAAIDTAIAELSVAAPTATPTLRTGLMLLYMTLRNKLVVQTSGTDAIEVYNNAGTKIASKLITDDGSDYTEAEMS